ncbi:TPA: hypothetical protein ACH3X1_000871 [Trebouxia sp. C0004]
MSDACLQEAPAYKKRKAGGRPIEDNIWKHFKQIDLPADKARKAKRNHDAECRHCGKAFNSDRMEADSMQISNAASTSAQPAVVSPRG